MTMYVEFDR